MTLQSMSFIFGAIDPPPLAAKSATTTIPIVFTSSSDPVKLGLVASLKYTPCGRTGIRASGIYAALARVRPALIALRKFPNVAITDITYVTIATGFVYLAAILDAWSRQG